MASPKITNETDGFGIWCEYTEEAVGPKREEMKGGWTEVHNEELHNLYFSPDCIRTRKSRRMSRECSSY
jgi:hypothetical protein